MVGFPPPTFSRICEVKFDGITVPNANSDLAQMFYNGTVTDRLVHNGEIFV